MNKLKRFLIVTILLALCLPALEGCKKYWPTENDAFNMDMNFSETEFKPILGRNTYYSNVFGSDQSTLPLTFRIINPRSFDGDPVPELQMLFPVRIWTKPYTGLEKSLDEIYAKTDTIMRPIWEIGKHSGAFTMWNTAGSELIKTEPDSCYLFDVEVSNHGGRRYFRDLKLKPQVEQPAEASGGISINIVGDSTRQAITDAQYWLNRKGNGNSVTFKFMDPKLKPIKLSKFNEMSTSDWQNLVHGFNMRFANDSTSITFDVAYPIPLVPTTKTNYNNGTEALSVFKFSRIAFAGIREYASLGVIFSIHQQGDWEIVIYFPTEAPLFAND